MVKKRFIIIQISPTHDKYYWENMFSGNQIITFRGSEINPKSTTNDGNNDFLFVR
jgi:hypothetical protein